VGTSHASARRREGPPLVQGAPHFFFFVAGVLIVSFLAVSLDSSFPVFVAFFVAALLVFAAAAIFVSFFEGWAFAASFFTAFTLFFAIFGWTFGFSGLAGFAFAFFAVAFALATGAFSGDFAGEDFAGEAFSGEAFSGEAFSGEAFFPGFFADAFADFGVLASFGVGPFRLGGVAIFFPDDGASSSAGSSRNGVMGTGDGGSDAV